MVKKKPALKKKTPSKKPAKKQNWFKRFLNLVKRHKLLTFLLILLALFPFSYANEKYKDWDNAQMIKGLARDFPELVEEIEVATGLDLEEKVSCMTTTEKFSSGVRTCDLSVGYKGLEDAENILDTVSMSRYGLIRYGDIINTTRRFTYRSKNSCSMWFAAPDAFRVECIMAIRDANAQLIKEAFSE